MAKKKENTQAPAAKAGAKNKASAAAKPTPAPAATKKGASPAKPAAVTPPPTKKASGPAKAPVAPPPSPKKNTPPAKPAAAAPAPTKKSSGTAKPAAAPIAKPAAVASSTKKEAAPSKPVAAAPAPAPTKKEAAPAKPKAAAAKAAPATPPKKESPAPMAKPATPAVESAATPPAGAPEADPKLAAARARFQEGIDRKKNAAQLREESMLARKAEYEARMAEKAAANKAAADARAAAVAAQKAKQEADRAERLKANSEAASTRAARLAEQKAKSDAAAADRAAAQKAAAEKRAALLAESRAKSEARKTERPAAQPTAVARPAAKPSAVTPKAAGGAKPPKAAAFDIGMALRLDQNWEEVIGGAMRNAGKSASDQLKDLLKMPADLDAKGARPLEAAKAKLMRALERAIAGSLTRLITPAHLAFETLQLSADGQRVIVPSRMIQHSTVLENKVASSYRDVAQVIAEPGSPLQAMYSKTEIKLMFGDTLPNDYFFSGTFTLQLDAAQASENVVKQEIHLFAKRGKKMGPQFKLSLDHDLSGKIFTGFINADFPVLLPES